MGVLVERDRVHEEVVPQDERLLVRFREVGELVDVVLEAVDALGELFAFRGAHEAPVHRPRLDEGVEECYSISCCIRDSNTSRYVFNL